MKPTIAEIDQRLAKLSPTRREDHAPAISLLLARKRKETKAKQGMDFSSWCEHVRYRQEEGRQNECS